MHEVSVHNGVDLRAFFDTVYSVARGVINQVGYDQKAGNFVIINYDGDVSVSYCHLSRILVKAGQSVEAGQMIGISGATGEATGAHLHFVLRVNGKCVNPLPILLAIKGLYLFR